MAEKNAGTPKYSDLASTAAAIAAVAAFIEARKKGEVPPEQDLTQVLEILAAIAQNDLAILEAVRAISTDGGLILGIGPNADSIRVFAVLITAANTPIQLPDCTAPHNMAFAVKAGPANAGVIRIGPSSPESTNPNASWPLIANEGVLWRIKNSKVLWCSGNWVGDLLYGTVEQMKGGA